MTLIEIEKSLNKMGFTISSEDWNEVTLFKKTKKREDGEYATNFYFEESNFEHCCGALELGAFYIDEGTIKSLPREVIDLLIQWSFLHYLEEGSNNKKRKKGGKFYPTSTKVVFITNGCGVSKHIERALAKMPSDFIPVSQWFNSPNGNFLTLWVAVN